MNPWGLTRRQVQAMDCLTREGCRKVVAYKMEISEQCLCQMIRRVCTRMRVRTDMQAVVTFDRWRRK